MTTITSDVITADPDPANPGHITADDAPAAGRPANGPGRSGWSADRTGDRGGPASDRSAGQSAAVPRRRGPIPLWPLLVLAAPAAVAVWSGWVGIGQMTGFGEIRPLPGIWGSLHVDTAVTLPVGVEAYAAFALRVWLTSNPVVSDQTRRFARWSAIAALVLGMAGQVAYHLLTQAGVTRAPWEVTTAVSCLPVLVLGMGSALAHLLRSDASSADAQAQFAQQTDEHELAGQGMPHCSGQDQPGPGAHIASAWPDKTLLWHDDRAEATREPSGPPEYVPSARPPARMRPSEAYTAAAKVIASGQQVSRRSLRSAGLHGSNADLGMLARLVRARPSAIPALRSSEATAPASAVHSAI
jgi:hypothetical protein